jgi:hypothetical protein
MPNHILRRRLKMQGDELEAFLGDVQKWLVSHSDWDPATRLVTLQPNAEQDAHLIWPRCYSLPIIHKPRVIFLFNGANDGCATIFDAGLHGSSYEVSCASMRSDCKAKSDQMCKHEKLYEYAGFDLQSLLRT